MCLFAKGKGQREGEVEDTEEWGLIKSKPWVERRGWGPEPKWRIWLNEEEKLLTNEIQGKRCSHRNRHSHRKIVGGTGRQQVMGGLASVKKEMKTQTQSQWEGTPLIDIITNMKSCVIFLQQFSASLVSLHLWSRNAGSGCPNWPSIRFVQNGYSKRTQKREWQCYWQCYAVLVKPTVKLSIMLLGGWGSENKMRKMSGHGTGWHDKLKGQIYSFIHALNTRCCLDAFMWQCTKQTRALLPWRPQSIVYREKIYVLDGDTCNWKNKNKENMKWERGC